MLPAAYTTILGSINRLSSSQNAPAEAQGEVVPAVENRAGISRRGRAWVRTTRATRATRLQDEVSGLETKSGLTNHSHTCVSCTRRHFAVQKGKTYWNLTLYQLS